MLRFAPVGAALLVTLLWAADDQPKQAQVEPMSQERFSEIHAPLLQAPKSNDAGAVTERIAASLPGAKTVSAPVPKRGFIDEQIFGKMERDSIPHAGLTGDNEFLRHHA